MVQRKKSFFLIVDLDGPQVTARLLDASGQVLASKSQTADVTSNAIGIQFKALQTVYLVRSVLRQLFQDNIHNQKHCEGIGIVSTHKGIVIWDSQTSLPLYDAVVSEPQNNHSFNKINHTGDFPRILKENTGKKLLPNTPVVAIKWILSEMPEVAIAVAKGRANIAPLASWVLFNLTGRKHFSIDHSLATGMGLVSLATSSWDSLILKDLGVKSKSLPKIRPASAFYGETEGFIPLRDGLPILAMSSKAVSRLYGCDCHQYGDNVLHCSDNAVFSVNLGHDVVRHPVHDTFSFVIKDKLRFGINSNIDLPVNLFPFFSNGRRLDDVLQTLEVEGEDTFDSEGVMVVPGEYDELDCEQNWHIFGMKSSTTETQILKAIIQGYVFSIKKSFDAFEASTGFYPKLMQSIGGPFIYAGTVQFLSNILQIPIRLVDDMSSVNVGMVSLIRLFLLSASDEKITYKPVTKLGKQIIPSMDPISSLSLFNEWQDKLKEVL